MKWKGWSKEDRAAIVKAFFDDGESAGKIAARYGVSRNAIIGVAHRHGAKNHAPKAPAPAKPSGKAPPPRRGGMDFARAARLEAATTRAALISGKAKVIGRRPSVLIDGARFVPLVSLGAHDCRFPITPHGIAPDAHRFCGLPAEGTYCPHHARLCRL
jgi:hypothetical protein